MDQEDSYDEETEAIENQKKYWENALSAWPQEQYVGYGTSELNIQYFPESCTEDAMRVWQTLDKYFRGMSYRRQSKYFIVDAIVAKRATSGRLIIRELDRHASPTGDPITVRVVLDHVLCGFLQFDGGDDTTSRLLLNRKHDMELYGDYDPVTNTPPLIPQSRSLETTIVGPCRCDRYVSQALSDLLNMISFHAHPFQYNGIIRAIYRNYQKYYKNMKLVTYGNGMMHFFDTPDAPLIALSRPAQVMPFLESPLDYERRVLVYEQQLAFGSGTHDRLGKDSSLGRAINGALGGDAVVKLMPLMADFANISFDEDAERREVREQRRLQKEEEQAEAKVTTAAPPPPRPTRTQKVVMRKAPDGSKTFFAQTMDEHGQVVDEMQLSGPPHIRNFLPNDQEGYDLQQERLRRFGTLYPAVRPEKRKNALPLDDEEKSQDLVTRPPSTQRRRGPEGKRPAS
jgi:hypothetical protein